jgi:von Willebrand factor type A domain
MQIDFLTPLAALVGLAAVVPLVAWVVADRRVARVRAGLRLRPPRGRGRWARVAVAATLALVALAAAQPVLSSSAGTAHERNGEVFVVLDTSESMRAGSPTRFTRAVAAARRIERALPGVRVGLASDTDRVLPHLFPTIDEADFDATLRSALGIDRPPPSRLYREATGFDSLGALANARFFAAGGPRVAVMLTDGESRSFAAVQLARSLARAHVTLVLVRFWQAGERIAGDSVYRADPSSAVALDAFAAAMGSRVYDERHLEDAIAAVRRALGPARPVPPPKGAASARPLAPYAMLAALLPLAALVYRRNIA